METSSHLVNSDIFFSVITVINVLIFFLYFLFSVQGVMTVMDLNTGDRIVDIQSQHFLSTIQVS